MAHLIHPEESTTLVSQPARKDRVKEITLPSGRVVIAYPTVNVDCKSQPAAR
jgi:hypothetical protein